MDRAKNEPTDRDIANTVLNDAAAQAQENPAAAAVLAQVGIGRALLEVAAQIKEQTAQIRRSRGR